MNLISCLVNFVSPMSSSKLTGLMIGSLSFCGEVRRWVYSPAVGLPGVLARIQLEFYIMFYIKCLYCESYMAGTKRFISFIWSTFHSENFTWVGFLVVFGCKFAFPFMIGVSRGHFWIGPFQFITSQFLAIFILADISKTENSHINYEKNSSNGSFLKLQTQMHNSR